MQEQQLIEIEAEVRAILESVGLQWILESVDSSLASGLSIEKGITIRQRRRWSHSGYREEEFAEIIQPGSHERPQRIVATDEPFSQQERISSLLAALRRAASELPALQEETFKTCTKPTILILQSRASASCPMKIHLRLGLPR